MYAIVGSNGYLGSYLIKNILEHTDDNVMAISRSSGNVYNDSRVNELNCDITDFKAVQELNVKLSVYPNLKIIFLAAYHHPDKVAENPKIAWDINITSLSYFLNAIDNVESFFYASTDTVYGDGKISHPFNEEDKLSPVNLYGKHKVLAEALVTSYGYNVARFPFLIGPSLISKKHFYDIIVDNISSGNAMEMFSDSYRSALDFNSASKLLIELIEKNIPEMPPIINISGDQHLSKYDIGLMIANKINVDKKLIKDIKVSDNQEIFKVKRAATAILDNSKIKKLLGIDEIIMSL